MRCLDRVPVQKWLMSWGFFWIFKLFVFLLFCFRRARFRFYETG